MTVTRRKLMTLAAASAALPKAAFANTPTEITWDEQSDPCTFRTPRLPVAVPCGTGIFHGKYFFAGHGRVPHANHP